MVADDGQQQGTGGVGDGCPLVDAFNHFSLVFLIVQVHRSIFTSITSIFILLICESCNLLILSFSATLLSWSALKCTLKQSNWRANVPVAVGVYNAFED